jgi:hypothetical protein
VHKLSPRHVWCHHWPHRQHVQRPLPLRHLRVDHGQNHRGLHRAVRCGAVRPRHLHSHRFNVRRPLHCGLLLPRGLVLCNAGGMSRGLLLPRGRGRGHALSRGLLLPCGRRRGYALPQGLLLPCWLTLPAALPPWHLWLCSQPGHAGLLWQLHCRAWLWLRAGLHLTCQCHAVCCRLLLPRGHASACPALHSAWALRQCRAQRAPCLCLEPQHSGRQWRGWVCKCCGDICHLQKSCKLCHGCARQYLCG